MKTGYRFPHGCVMEIPIHNQSSGRCSVFLQQTLLCTRAKKVRPSLAVSFAGLLGNDKAFALLTPLLAASYKRGHGGSVESLWAGFQYDQNERGWSWWHGQVYLWLRHKPESPLRHQHWDPFPNPIIGHIDRVAGSERKRQYRWLLLKRCSLP